jgi:site-specific DNA-methyltransferase (adenine-specific)
VIFDPFMGSGTTAAGCATLGRKLIGVEINEKYFEIACRRTADGYAQPDMFIDQPPNPKLASDLFAGAQ